MSAEKKLVEKWFDINVTAIDEASEAAMRTIRNNDEGSKAVLSCVETIAKLIDENGYQDIISIDVDLGNIRSETIGEKIEDVTTLYYKRLTKLQRIQADTLLLLDMCETYEQKIGVLKNKGILTDEMCIQRSYYE